MSYFFGFHISSDVEVLSGSLYCGLTILQQMPAVTVSIIRCNSNALPLLCNATSGRYTGAFELRINEM